MCECVTDGVWGNIIGWHKVGWDRFLWWDVAVWCIALWLLPPPRSQNKTALIIYHCQVQSWYTTSEILMYTCAETHTIHVEIYTRGHRTLPLCGPAPLSVLTETLGMLTFNCESSHCVMSHVFPCPRSELQNMPPSGIVAHCVMKSEAGAWREV